MGRSYKNNDTGYSERCHTTHKELQLGGGVILGASCNSPRPGYDVYVGFDWGMRIESLAPWRKGAASEALHAKFEIPDGRVPKDRADFDAMILWLADQLHQGKRVHIGCIGGHGRTGLVLAVLKCVIDDDKKAAQWVREQHCKKAIETSEQVAWLQDHYGIEPVEPSRKSWSSNSFDYGKHSTGGKGLSYAGKGKAIKKEEMGSSGSTPWHAGSAASSRPVGEGMRVIPLRNSLTLFY